MRYLTKQILTTALAISTLATTVSAAEITTPGGTGESKLELVAEPSNFSVTVPMELPIQVDSDGKVTVATNAVIENNSTSQVKVTSVDINRIAGNGWELVDTADGLQEELIGTKKAYISVSNPTSNSIILPNDSIGVVYVAEIAPQYEKVSTALANVVFTIDWNKPEPTTQIQIIRNNLYVPKGATMNTTDFGVNDEDYNGTPIVSVSNINVATVTDYPGAGATGYQTVSFNNYGTTKVTLTNEINNKSVECSVTVMDPVDLQSIHYSDKTTYPNGPVISRSILTIPPTITEHKWVPQVVGGNGEILVPEHYEDKQYYVRSVQTIPYGDYDVIAFPNSITELNIALTRGNTRLKSIDLSAARGCSIPDYAFADCTNLTSVSLPDFAELGNNLFHNTTIQDIKVPKYTGYCTNPNNKPFLNVPHITYTGPTGYGEPWGALSMN